MMQATRLTAASMALLGLVVSLSFCNDGAMVERGMELESPRELAAREVDRLGDRLDVLVEERAAQVTESIGFPSAVQGHELMALVDERLAAVARELYQERHYKPVFVEGGDLTEAGRGVLQVLSEAWVHGLQPIDYQVEVANAAAAMLRELEPILDGLPEVRLEWDEREALVSYLAGRPGLLELNPDELSLHLFEVLVHDEEGDQPVVPRISDLLSTYYDALAAYRGAQAELEVALALGFLGYAHDMRYFNPVWFEGLADDNPEALEELVRDALKSAFVSGLGPEGFTAVFQGLLPPYQQYGRLVEAHRRYREIARRGGWPQVEFVDIRPGREYDMIPALRRRLAAEGYFQGDLESREYDRELRQALIDYQVSHQFEDDGRMTESLVRSLNASALRRAQQIALALQRWRESEIGNDSYYVFVNPPDFHVEVWRDGNRDMRFRAIVGSTDTRVQRETGQTVFYRATPEVHRSLRYIVFNPYWNVPPDIMINEYDPLLEEDPNWYENNGYEVMYNPDGSRWVRQLPGPENALGLVKFLFPNPFDVYMHDTPLKNLFRRSFRAFSHGCIRIQDPLDFAEYLLGNDRGWRRERIEEELASGPDIWVNLRRPIPVHVEYYVVRVDDEGTIHFFSDLYRRDQARFQALLQEEMSLGVRWATEAVGEGLQAARQCLVELPPADRCARLDAVSPGSAQQSE